MCELVISDLIVIKLPILRKLLKELRFYFIWQNQIEETVILKLSSSSKIK